MIPLRKARAGSCSLGYTWPHDGSVVEVTNEHAHDLLSIPDGDYSVADAAPEPEPAAAIEEPAPEAEVSEAPAPRPAKKTAARKSAAAAPATVEE